MPITDPIATARAKKAEAIADKMYEMAKQGGFQLLPHSVDNLSLPDKDGIARHAGQRAASAETWAVVRSLIETRGPDWSAPC